MAWWTHSWSISAWRRERLPAANDTGGAIVVALGGNAIARAGDDGRVETQYLRAIEALRPVARLIASGARVVLTHGNGPVVGNIVIRGEIARADVEPTPLFIADADSEGGIGLMLQQVLGNQLRELGCDRVPVAVVTQVVVDPDDPAFSAPTKPIGPVYTAEHATELARVRGWSIAEQPGSGWRRVVASPLPLRIIESVAIAALLDAGFVPVAAGGGGVPVVEHDGMLAGIDAVIDKDRTSALLATDLVASHLVILMEADAVYADWGTPAARPLRRLCAEDAEKLARGEGFSAGSIGPKLEAAARFAHGGGVTVICRAEDLDAALAGEAGTMVAG